MFFFSFFFFRGGDLTFPPPRGPSFGMGAAYLVVRLSRRQACSGEGSLLMNVLINAVFLALFTQFYNNKGNYAARKSRAGKKAE